jgi:hypothetical protein
METSPALPLQLHVLDVLPQQPGEPVTAVMDRIREAMTDLPQADIEVAHYFAEGLYARQAVIPKGVMMVGKIHLTGHINVLLEGTIDVMTELGVERYTGPAVIVSNAGEQKVGYALTKSTWLTIHATTETDIDKLEQQLATTDLSKRGLR